MTIKVMPKMLKGGKVPFDASLKVGDKAELMLVKKHGSDDVAALLTSGEVVLPVHAVKKAGKEIKAVLERHNIHLPNFAGGGKVTEAEAQKRVKEAKKEVAAKLREAMKKQKEKAQEALKKEKAKAKAKPQARVGRGREGALQIAKQIGNGPKAQAVIFLGDEFAGRKRRAPAKPRAPKPKDEEDKKPPRQIQGGYLMPPQINVHVDNPFRGQAVQPTVATVVPQAQGPQPVVTALDRQGAINPVPTQPSEVPPSPPAPSVYDEAPSETASQRRRLLAERALQRMDEAQRARQQGAPSPVPSEMGGASFASFSGSPPLSWFPESENVSLRSYAFRSIGSEGEAAGARQMAPPSEMPSEPMPSIFQRPLIDISTPAVIPSTTVVTLEDLMRQRQAVETQTPAVERGEIETQTPAVERGEVETQTPMVERKEIETQTDFVEPEPPEPEIPEEDIKDLPIELQVRQLEDALREREQEGYALANRILSRFSKEALKRFAGSLGIPIKGPEKKNETIILINDYLVNVRKLRPPPVGAPKKKK